MKKKSSLSFREIFMLVFLVVLVVGVAYYMGFYTPLQNELADIARQSSEVDAQIAGAASQVVHSCRIFWRLSDTARMDHLSAKL